MFREQGVLEINNAKLSFHSLKSSFIYYYKKSTYRKIKALQGY